MRDLTPEEKELIVNTILDLDCFDFDYEKMPSVDLDILAESIANLRRLQRSIRALRTSKRKDEAIDFFTGLLPKAYNIVKLWHTPEEEPILFGKYANERYPQIPCLVDIKNYGYGVRYWNVKEKCWDGEDCDDYYCDMDKVIKWSYIKED